MLKSMTAYGQAAADCDLGHIVAEVSSLNKKFLEVQLFLPRFLSSLESDLRRWISNQIARGQVTVRISLTLSANAPIKVTSNLALAKEMHRAWKEVGEAVGESNGFTLGLLQDMSSLFSIEERIGSSEACLTWIQAVLTDALKGFDAVKAREGSALADDLLARGAAIANFVDAIDERKGIATEKRLAKLKNALEEALPGSAGNDERLLREALVYADRFDISEEVTRMRSHLEQFVSLIQSDDSRVGKHLEFLLQEMGREVNTMGSKSSDIDITRATIEIKNELERIREQVQNVE